jgi:Tfp pilus assembly PilM family ATPase
MGKKPLTFVAFEIGTDNLKLVEMTREENRVLSAGIFPLTPGRGRDSGHLASQIRLALETTARGNLRGLIASVALGEAALRVIEVPPDAEADEYAAWDMSLYLGLPVGEFTLDVSPGAGDGTESQTVVAAALPIATTTTLRDTLETATGLVLTALDVDAAALVNVFGANYPELASDRALLIHANTAATALVRTHKGEFHGAVARRDAKEALRADADAQERAEGLLRLARGIAETVRTSADGWDSPSHIMLCGDLATDTDFRELLRAHLSQPVSLFNPFRNIPGPDPLEFAKAYPGGPLAATVGLALRLVEESR